MAEARKVVTVLFSDVAGSTSLGEQLDPEALRRVMERYFDEMRTILERHGGTVEKFIGDAVVAAFGIPATHEDDALRAIRAAAEMRTRLQELNEELLSERGVTLTTRVGINTGEVVAGDPSEGHFYASGDAVNVAARLEQAAKPGEILLGDQTYRLVRNAVSVEPLEPLEPKGKSQPVHAFRLLKVIEGAPALARRLDTPFVGREAELTRLIGCFEHALAEQAPVLVTVLGPAGIGKTRLATELIAHVELRATVVQGRCLSYGEGITFWPLQEIMRSLPDLPRGVPNPDDARSTEDSFWAYRKLFEALAQARPLVLLLEDIHWAEPTLLDLIEHVAEWTREAQIMILCLARSELLDDRPGWAGQRIELAPLSNQAAESLAARLASELEPSKQTRAIEAAEGNPLFLEQLLALAGEDGQELAVPDTIQALLTARLDRLALEERVLLEAAAVVGNEFWRSALLELSPPDTEVSALLQRLVRKRLIQPERSTFPGEEDAFRFGHILIREAAYAGIPKARRADLHERFAEWLDASASPYEEIVGYHLEQAYRYREGLGPIDEHGEDLARRGSELLAAAGRMAWRRGDDTACANLLSRAAGLHPRAHPLRLALLPELGESLFYAGRYSEARSILAEAVGDAQRAGDRGVEWRARLMQTRMDVQVGERLITNREMEQRAREARAVFEELGDPGGEAVAGFAIGTALRWQFRYEEMVRVIDEALEKARLAGDEFLEAGHARLLMHALEEGPTPVAEAIDRGEAMVAVAGGQQLVEHWILSSLSNLYAQAGRLDEARECLRRVLTYAEQFGSEVGIAAILAFRSARVDRFAGDLEQAEAHLRRSYEVLERFGESGMRSTVAVLLARVLIAQGRFEEAEEFLKIGEATSTSDDLATEVPLRVARAEIAVTRGQAREAETLVREALSLLEGTDDLGARADALLTYAKVLRAAGRTSEALSAAEEGLQLFEKKGIAVKASEARGLLDDLAAVRTTHTTS
jgi:class 3 adenylate cyclase/tetratricopeptide (TPR) repeat protein